MSIVGFYLLKRNLLIIFLIKLTVFIVFGFCGTAVFAWEITGNKKTKTPHIISVLKKCHSSYGAERCMLNTKLFSEVKISGKKITVKERHTLIPIPFFSSSGSERSAGAYLIESNFMGYGDLLVVGGSVSNRGSNALLIYKNNSVNFSDFTFSVSFITDKKNYELYSGKNGRFEYSDDTLSLGAGPGYKFGFFETDVKAAYERRRFDKFENYDALAITPLLRYKNVRFKFHSEEGLNAALFAPFSFSSYPKSEILFESSYQKNAIRDHILHISLTTYKELRVNTAASLKFGAQRGLRGIDKESLSASRLAALGLDWQIPLKHTDYGTWVAAPFFDFGNLNSRLTRGENYFSFGAGGFLYLKKIALPGLGLYVGHNNKFESSFVNFFMGASF
jgi:hypothetical protein